MHMLVTPMRRQGVALSSLERRRYQAIRGNVMVNSENSVELGRSANVARVDVGMPLDPDPLPLLLDATLAGMAVTGFVLSGIEYIDGCAYAQSWWCRLE
ncbi:hypothetical protein [Pseudomonas fluorescens]|uniref:hypothetical protein n=1 Tax=Pseudomonas fluorescens TaxID=294 RepID=UPI0012B7EAA7|nr:hypothetical protein [Pseudomonas fluorescens]